ncbi:MAG: histidine triad nucleotide-binding protein [Parcubacteria group bacterium]|jgi:histidine triad (HIT) family protein
MEDCIFCKIAHKDIPTKFLYESERVVAFRDTHPIAPVHVLVIPKRHIPSMNDVTKDNAELLGELLLVVQSVAKDLDIAQSGYKTLIRTGKHGGQEVPHIHVHLIGGARLSENIRPIA